jgi:hypothetical protein
MPQPQPDDQPAAPQPDASASRRRPTALRKRRHGSAAQTLGGVLFGFEQQVWRTAPPPQELVHHARPDAPLPAGDGTLITIALPDGFAPPTSERPAAVGVANEEDPEP